MAPPQKVALVHLRLVNVCVYLYLVMCSFMRDCNICVYVCTGQYGPLVDHRSLLAGSVLIRQLIWQIIFTVERLILTE